MFEYASFKPFSRPSAAEIGRIVDGACIQVRNTPGHGGVYFTLHIGFAGAIRPIRGGNGQ